MYMCNCNPFSDKKVTEYLAETGEANTVRVADVYKACSGGAKPQCGTCLSSLKDIVTEHNNAATVHRMKENLPVPVQTFQPSQRVS